MCSIKSLDDNFTMIGVSSTLIPAAWPALVKWLKMAQLTAKETDRKEGNEAEAAKRPSQGEEGEGHERT